MSLKENTVYSVIASPNTCLGFVLDGKFFGTHYSERGPVSLSDDLDFVIDGLVMRRLKDGVEFKLVEVEGDVALPVED